MPPAEKNEFHKFTEHNRMAAAVAVVSASLARARQLDSERGREAAIAKNGLESHDREQRETPGPLATATAERRAELAARLETARNAKVESEKELVKMEAEFAALKTRLEAGSFDAGSALAEYAASKKALISRQAKIDESIKRLEAIVAEAEVPIPDLTELNERKAALLARAALGEKINRELEAVNQELAQAEEAKQKAITARNAALAKTSDARLALEGLKAEAQKAAAELAELEAHEKPLVQAWLLEEGKAAGEEYIEAAGNLIRHFENLSGIEALLQ